MIKNRSKLHSSMSYLLVLLLVISGIITMPLNVGSWNAYATDKVPYAEKSEDEKTLYIKYDGSFHEYSENQVEIEDGGKYYNWDEWVNSDGEYDFTKVVIADSFKDYHELTTMSEWFSGFTALTTIEGLTNLDTSEVTDMNGLFFECGELTSLDLSSFETANVENMEMMFDSCSSLKTIIVDKDKWSTTALALDDADIDNEDIFDGCESLEGGAGTTYDADNIGYEYAHIDGGAENPGYLTEKTNETASSVTTAPNANTLTYNGSDQILVTAGTAENGTMQYALGSDNTTEPENNWAASIPKGKDAKDYYVWYRAKGTEGYTDSDAACIKVTIAKKAATVTATDQIINEDGEIETGTSKATLTDAVSGHVLSAVTLAADKTAKTITPTEASIKDANNNDVSGNYAITFTSGKLTIRGKLSYKVTFKVVNGKWENDEQGIADIEVTLSGYEGDTLKLSADQIPAVGNNPDTNYKAGSWDTAPNAETEITADTTYTYTYAAKESVSHKVTFKVENGSWNDGKTENVEVTLSGYEGDTLKLSADQIPAVGNKPNDTFKTGSWDTAPNAETEITADTTYTYTYAEKEAVSHKVTFKVENGSWNEGEGGAATANKIVTLTGYEGDTLKLSADQIPSVGSKPNDEFKEGHWDVEPNAESAITEDVTYTYSYIAKDAISKTVTFKVSRGEWNDETTADKVVTLSGLEGDTLRLFVNQIPAVGDKPAEGYKAGSWDTVPSTDTEITADTTYTYTYAAKETVSHKVTFKVENGSWNEGEGGAATANKIVTLTGYEGDTLKLSANQIPAVGDKPDEGYKAGSWDTVPSTDAEITDDTTYTYTYAAKENNTGGGGGAFTDTVKAVIDKINALPADPSVSDADAVKAANDAYNALTADQKKDERLTSEVLSKLNDAVDTVAAKTVESTIASLPETITADNAKDVAAAKAAYDALTDAQKAKVSADSLCKLETAVKAARAYQTGEDGTALGRGASFEMAEAAILGMTSDADPAGSKLMPLKVKSVKQTKKSVKVQWSKPTGAVKYVIYGNKCGTKNKMKRLKTTTKASINFKKIAGKKVKKGTSYKFIVVALDKDNNVVSTSKVAHAVTKGSKKGNPTKLTVKSPKSLKKTLTVGKSFTIKCKISKKKGTKVYLHVAKNYKGLRYESSNTKVATVTKTGKVKAISAGTAKICVYAQNGVNKLVNIAVN